MPLEVAQFLVDTGGDLDATMYPDKDLAGTLLPAWITDAESKTDDEEAQRLYVLCRAKTVYGTLNAKRIETFREGPSSVTFMDGPFDDLGDPCGAYKRLVGEAADVPPILTAWRVGP